MLDSDMWKFLKQSFEWWKRAVMTHGDQRALAECIDPVFIPQHREEIVIQTWFEDLNLELIVLISMYTEIFDLAERDRLILGGWSIRRGVIFRERAEGANVDFSSWDGAVWINLRRSWSKLLSKCRDVGGVMNAPPLLRTDPGIFGYLVVCWHRYRRASTHNQDGNGTSRLRFPDGQPMRKG